MGFAGRLALAAVLGALASAPLGAQPAYRPLGAVLTSKPNGYFYAYAPTIMREGDTWHLWYCSTGDGRAWDFVRYATSGEGRSWSAPAIALRASAGPHERAACDPSVVRFQARDDARPYYYLFYSGTPQGTNTAMFVARAERPTGPFAKWTGAAWEPDGPATPIIRPAVPHGDGSGFYGAGQQSVVVRDGRLHAWFLDDTTCGAERCEKIFATATDDPTSWPDRQETDVRVSSVDVKWDAVTRRYTMVAIANPHVFGSFLVRYGSADGINWGRPEIVAQPTAFTHYAHNAGQAGDPSGHTVAGDTLVMFGAPRAAECGTCWGYWDLAGGLVPGRGR